ncbi:hypothetical protein, partial [Streptomyces sp. NPDC056600]|uniref:hypothetical protein n=1 Tax=Streptomyces sp. NPDC056600 TaxID=3345874 RepID=UPI00367EDB47
MTWAIPLMTAAATTARAAGVLRQWAGSETRIRCWATSVRILPSFISHGPPTGDLLGRRRGQLVSMMFVTAPGRLIITAREASTSSVCAPARSDMKRWTSGAIAWSWRVTR